MTILVIKSPPTQNFPVIKSLIKSRRNPKVLSIYILPLPLNQARNTTSSNQTVLTLAYSTKMTHNTIPQVDSSAHQIPFIYISLSTPHINTQHVTSYASSPRRFMRTWILAHNPIVFSISKITKIITIFCVVSLALHHPILPWLASDSPWRLCLS